MRSPNKALLKRYRKSIDKFKDKKILFIIDNKIYDRMSFIELEFYKKQIVFYCILNSGKKAEKINKLNVYDFLALFRGCFYNDIFRKNIKLFCNKKISTEWQKRLSDIVTLENIEKEYLKKERKKLGITGSVYK